MKFSCPRCHATVTAEAWSRLALVDELRHADVRHAVVRWPWGAEVVVAVRRCICGALFARREPG